MKRNGTLLAVVPDIALKLPLVSDLLPHHNILAGNLLRRWTLGLQAEDPDLARRRGPERLDIEGYELWIADLLRDDFPYSPRLQLGPSQWRSPAAMPSRHRKERTKAANGHWITIKFKRWRPRRWVHPPVPDPLRHGARPCAPVNSDSCPLGDGL